MSGRWRHTFLAVKAGQVEKLPLMMALSKVGLARLKHAACKKMIKSEIILFQGQNLCYQEQDWVLVV